MGGLRATRVVRDYTWRVVVHRYLGQTTILRYVAIRGHPGRHRNIFWRPFGVVRCGIGELWVVFVPRVCFVTIRGACRPPVCGTNAIILRLVACRGSWIGSRMRVGLAGVFAFVAATFVRANCAKACCVLVVRGPSLQAPRAETRVERFTARMHVVRRRGVLRRSIWSMGFVAFWVTFS